VPNLPPNLGPPDTAVTVSKPLRLTIRATEDESDEFEGVQMEVLAIGWRSDHERLYYLVFDGSHNEVFWVDPDYIATLTG
jgi:hypothetical protein